MKHLALEIDGEIEPKMRFLNHEIASHVAEGIVLSRAWNGGTCEVNIIDIEDDIPNCDAYFISQPGKPKKKKWWQLWK